MKTVNLDPEHQLDVTRGRKNPQQASGSGVTYRDSTAILGPIWDLTVIGATLTDNGDGTAVLTIGDTEGIPDHPHTSLNLPLGTTLLTVDAGTPSYSVAGADVVVTYASDFGYDADGPYYDDTGAASGEEAILALDPVSGVLAVIPYNP